jgi:hypothetical protein
MKNTNAMKALAWPAGRRLTLGADMSNAIRLVPKSERERTRLIREARAIYDSIFPSTGPVSEEAPPSHRGTDANAYRGDGVLLP